MRKLINAVLIAGLFISSIIFTENAYAAPLMGLGDIDHYGTVVFGDMVADQADVECPLAVLGDLHAPALAGQSYTIGAGASGGAFLIGEPITAADESYPTLMLGGTMSSVSGGGSMVIESVVSGTPGSANAVYTSTSDPSNIISSQPIQHTIETYANIKNAIDTIENQVVAYASDISTLTPDTQITGASLGISTNAENSNVLISSGITGIGTLNISSINIPNMDSYDLLLIYSDATTITFSSGAMVYDKDNDGTYETVINTAEPYSVGNDMDVLAPKILFVFPNATTINTTYYGIVGSVIAPNATLNTTGGSLNGQLWVNNFNQGGAFEVHNFRLDRTSLELITYATGEVTLTKTDGTSAITSDTADFQLYDSSDNPIIVTGTGGSYTYDSTGTAPAVPTTMTTDTNGEIAVSDLPYGDYYFVETDAPAGYRLDSTTHYTVTINSSAVTKDVANTKVYSLGDYVWIDADLDGVQDSGETAVANVTVTLYDASDDSVLATDTTDSSGKYLFEDLTAGNYYVVFSDIPTGYKFTEANSGTDDTDDSDADESTGRTAAVTLNDANTDSNNHYPDLDAGIYQYGGVTLTKTDGTSAITSDTADFQLYDSSDNPIIVTGTGGSYTYDSTGTAPAVPTTMTTDTNGEIAVSDLPYGDYYFVETDAPAGYRLDSTTHYTVTINSSAVTKDVANTKVYSLGDYVWIDADLDGVQDSGETPVENVTVTLYDASDDSVLATDTTDSSGKYLFENLSEGSYYVVFSDIPADYAFTTANTGSDNTIDSDAATSGSVGRTETVSLNDSNPALVDNHYAHLDAGIYLMTSSISFTKTDGTSPLSGAGFTLYDSSNNPIGGEVVSDTAGLVSFIDIPMGTGYYIRETTTPTNYEPLDGDYTFDVTSTGAIDDSGYTNNWTASGYVANNGILFSLGDYVWIDDNRDGIQDADESCLNAVIVTLYNSTGTQIGSPVATGSGTWPDGYYEFSGLPSGDYYIEFRLPTGYVFTIQNTGADEKVDSDADSSTGRTEIITLNEANTDSSNHYPELDAGVYWSVDNPPITTITENPKTGDNSTDNNWLYIFIVIEILLFGAYIVLKECDVTVNRGEK